MRVVAIMSEGHANAQMCLDVAAQHDLVAVYHPERRTRSLKRSFASFTRWRRSRGVAYVALHKMGRGGGILGWPRAKRELEAEAQFFAGCSADYERSIAPRVRRVSDVNSAAFIAELCALQPNAVICSGGPIYRAPLIRAVPIMLNYHTGISPLYNGADTILWAFVNGHPQLCGGTLMVMGESVDGGDILAHHFSGVEAGDDPATAFCRAIAGGARLYNEFLDDLAAGKPYNKVAQTRPFFYYRNLDWSVYQNLIAARCGETVASHPLTRARETVRYWRLESTSAARNCLEKVLMSRVLINDQG